MTGTPGVPTPDSGPASADPTPVASADPSPDGAKDTPAAAGKQPPSAARTISDAQSRVRDGEKQHVIAADTRRQAGEQLRYGGYVGNDFVAGDKFDFDIVVGREDAKLRVHRLTEERLEESFVRPPDFATFVQGAQDFPIVALRAPVGYGKQSLGLHMLLPSIRSGGHAYLLDPATNLKDFSCAGLAEGSIVVLADLPEQSADQLSDFAIGSLAEDLGNRGCRLAVTVTPGAHLREHPREMCVVDVVTRPLPDDVFKDHLAQQLADRPQHRENLLARPDVARFLREQLTDAMPLRQVSQLARILANYSDDLDQAVARAGQQMSRFHDDDCAGWFAGLPTLRTRCMAIALATLNGLPQEIVGAATDSLEEMLSDPPDLKNTAASIDPFRAGATSSLLLLRASVVQGSVSTVHGEIPASLICYNDSRFAGHVLHHVWREYDAVRQTMADWLSLLGGDPNPHVRARAATAVGALACDSFDFIKAAIILRWARSEDPRLRESAATSLCLPGTAARLRDSVRLLVKHWAADDDIMLRASAARVHGFSLGLEAPSYALAQLRMSAQDRDLDPELDIAIAVTDSLVELLTDGTPALAGRVLTEVEHWTSTFNADQRIACQLAFLGLAMSQAGDAVYVDGLRNVEAWPTLLALSTDGGVRHRQVASLWARGLNSRESYDLFRDTLDEWSERVEPAEEARAALCGLLKTAATDDRLVALISRRAETWCGRNGKAPLTGSRVLAALGRRSIR